MLDEAGKVLLGGRVPFSNQRGNPDEFADLVSSIIRNPMLNGSVIRIDEAQAKGAKLIVIEPRLTENARKTDLFLQVRPGEDATLLAAVPLAARD